MSKVIVEQNEVVYIQGYGFGRVNMIVPDEYGHTFEVIIANESKDVIYFDENGVNEELNLRFVQAKYLSSRDNAPPTAKLYEHPGRAMFELASENLYQSMEFLKEIDIEFAYFSVKDVFEQIANDYQKHLMKQLVKTGAKPNQQFIDLSQEPKK